MSALQRAFYRVYFESNDGGGAGDDDPDRVVSFGEAFGINPDGTPYEAPEADPNPDPDPAPGPDPDPSPPGEAAPGDATPPAGETPDQAVDRLYGGKYKSVEELEKAHKELTAAWDGRGQQKPEPPPAATEPPPKPLFKGDINEIANEEQLYKWAQTDPRAAAFFAMENMDRLDQETFDTVMNAWVAQQPFAAMAQIQAWSNDALREEFAEKGRVQEEAYVNTMRDQGIEMAIKDQPLLAHYADGLGDYIADKPHLNAMVEGARTAPELSNAIQAIFYMMAGPELAQQALTARVAAKVTEAQAAEAAAAAEAATGKATSINRNTAPPPDGEQDYGDMIREMVLNPGKGR